MLLESELKAITSQAGLMNQTFNLHYESGKPGALKAAVDALCKDVEQAVKNGCEVTAKLFQASARMFLLYSMTVADCIVTCRSMHLTCRGQAFKTVFTLLPMRLKACSSLRTAT